MKILMMILHFPPAWRGGAELQCWKQARALAARGHEVTILTQWWQATSLRRELRDGVVILRLGSFVPVTMAARRIHARLAGRHRAAAGVVSTRDPAQAFGSDAPSKQGFRWMSLTERPGIWSYMAAAGRLFQRGKLKADLIHVHESQWNAGFAQWAGEILGVPVFCKEAFQPVLREGLAADVPRAEEWNRRRLKCRFIAITGDIARDLAAAGIPAERIVEVPNGVELPAATVQPDRHSDAIYIGNFTQGAAHKGFDVLFRAWALAIRQEPAMRLQLFGRGDIDYWSRYAQEQGCGDSVVFAGQTSDVWSAHRQAGYLVLPSRVEGLSNALLEAMASGLPVVVSDIPGNLAAVTDGENGLVVPVGDAAALAVALVRMHRSPDLRARLGQAARARAADTFAIGQVAARLEAAYRQAIAADAAGRAAIGIRG